ncbi:MAG: glycerol-3-phosphate 1-O-acyltransferase PlsY [Sphingomonas sp.]|nr:glycerol-3-phosphate 1-O-acyltransferase PlsY [Sphingomonas sp.]
MTTELLLAFLTGYLLGAIPFGLLLTKASGKGDLRKVGSGNIGATNAMRAGGKALGALTLLLDALKGAVAVWIAQNFMGGVPGADVAAAAGALIGHLYPLWLKFRGGKGVATLFGILLALWPTGGLVYAVVWLLVAAATRISSLAGITAAASAPIAAAIFGIETLFPLLLGFALLVIWKHRENIARLRAGTETRVGKESREQRPD